MSREVVTSQRVCRGHVPLVLWAVHFFALKAVYV